MRRRPIAPDEFTVTAPVSIEVNARPIPSFDTRDRARVAVRRAGISQRADPDLAVSRLRRAVGISPRPEGRALHCRQRQRQLVHRPHRLPGPRDDRARRGRGGAVARARWQADHRARLVRFRSARARWHAGLCRHRAGAPDPALRFRQGIYPGARRGDSGAAGGAQTAQQQGAGSAGGGAEGSCRWRAR